jgi:quercetin dioxygenase-like cupin family protein
METPYLLTNVPLHVSGLTPDSILSRTLYGGDSLKAVLFEFAAGQALSEHTAASHSILFILSGQARLTLGPDAHDVAAGAWVHMPAGLPHSLLARSPVVMLLLLLKAESQ